ncbi:MAG TPA: BTAD domain-containing putative transcriptional regulator [Longimicrobium sp.]|nr:BTAD domain-containing putative transcriptional regulator [Longimicrobium sp.]
MYLKTLGHPALLRADGTEVEELRKKDLALLVYLCVENAPVHARARLASLLWGESEEQDARHSLTQAVRRLRRALPPGTLAPGKGVVRWCGELACDATTLLRGELEPREVDDAFSLYAGPFLEGFDPGLGVEEFETWADWRRAQLGNAALLLLECAGQEAEAARDWSRALRLAEREVQIDPLWEQGHRRLMRALAALGERNRALWHYEAFRKKLAAEEGVKPDPETRALAEYLRDLEIPAERTEAPPAAPPSPVLAPASVPDPPPAAVRDIPPDPPTAPGPLPEAVPEPPRNPPETREPGRPRGGRTRARRVTAGGVLVLAVALALALALALLVVWLLATAESGTGESRRRGSLSNDLRVMNNARESLRHSAQRVPRPATTPGTPARRARRPRSGAGRSR